MFNRLTSAISALVLSLAVFSFAEASELRAHDVKVRLSPLYLTLPGLLVDVSIPVGETGWAIGVGAETIHIESDNEVSKTKGVNLFAQYFVAGSPFVDSVYFMPRLRYQHGTDDTERTGYRSSYENEAYGLEAMLGYQWHWENFSVNMAFGGGVRRNHDFAAPVTDSGLSFTVPAQTETRVLGAGELTIGWAF